MHISIACYELSLLEFQLALLVKQTARGTRLVDTQTLNKQCAVFACAEVQQT